MWLAIRAVVRGSGASMLAAGVVVGPGVEAKPQVGLVAAVMAAALIVVGPVWRFGWAAGGSRAPLNLAHGDTVGWPRLVQTVSTAWNPLPIDQRQHTAILTVNCQTKGRTKWAILGSNQ